MNKLIITCANCGKRYRGNPGGKQFKCGACGNLLTIPATLRSHSSGKILCSNCWIDMDAREGLMTCSSCGEKIALAIGGKVIVSAASSSAQLASRDGGAQAVAAEDAIELQKCLNQTIQERDEIVAAHKKQEKVLSDLMAQLAFAKAAQAAVIKESDEPARWELQMEVGELKSRLESIEHQLKNAVQERNDARRAREEIDEVRRKAEAHISELERCLAAEKQTSAQSAPINLELERKISRLEQDVILTRQERDAAIKERDAACVKMNQAQDDLNRFRDAAVQALEPLSAEYHKAMKELVTESDTLISKARQQHEAANQQMSQLEALGASLKEHLLVARREMTQRLSQALGSPPADSAVQLGMDAQKK